MIRTPLLQRLSDITNTYVSLKLLNIIASGKEFVKDIKQISETLKSLPAVDVVDFAVFSSIVTVVWQCLCVSMPCGGEGGF